MPWSDELPAQRAFNAQVVTEARAHGGVVAGALDGMQIALLHHIGARSGHPYVTPLACYPRVDGRLIIVGTNGGSAREPGWCHNLRAHPRTVVEWDGEIIAVVAEELTSTTRSESWAAVTQASPSAREFEQTARRPIPVFLLTREND